MAKGDRRSNKLLIVIVLAVVFVLLAGGAAWYFAIRSSNHSPFSKEITSSVSFPLYYPTGLPDGYTLDKDNINSNGEIVNLSIVNSEKNQTITVSMQATPSGFDAAKIIGSASIPTTIVTVGTMYNLSLGDVSKYMIDTKAGTLIFITASTGTSAEAVTKTAQALTKLL